MSALFNIVLFCFMLLFFVLLFCRIDPVVKPNQLILTRSHTMPNAFHFDGRIASAPSLTRPGNSSVCKFTLIRNEFAGTDDQGQARPERKVAIQFTAFGKRAETIAQHGTEGDQLIVTARIDNNNYTKGDETEVFGFNFVVEDFDFGAPGARKREQLAARNGGHA